MRHTLSTVVSGQFQAGRDKKDRGPTVTRRALRVCELAWMERPVRQHWPKLAGVGMVEGGRDIADAGTLAHAARSHWGVGNRLH